MIATLSALGASFDGALLAGLLANYDNKLTINGRFNKTG
jgi:hypothetical protein